MLLASKNIEEINRLKAQMARTFDMKVLGTARQIFGMEIFRDRSNGKLWLSQQKYIEKILLRFGDLDKRRSTFRLSSQGPKHDEIDYEFLGNLSGDPYIMHTNIFAQGLGNREQQFYLWFDPTLAFHTYSVLWTPNQITFSVDGIPVHVVKNRETELDKIYSNYHYPKSQEMRIYFSLLNADDWATRGGLVKTDWTKAPFVASFSNFSVATSSSNFDGEDALDLKEEQKLQWV
eukprot:PITA_25451